VRLRAIGERRAIGELLEREPAFRRGFAQAGDRLLALGVRRALLELAAHSRGIL
jgi:hypothetical protein